MVMQYNFKKELNTKIIFKSLLIALMKCHFFVTCAKSTGKYVNSTDNSM